MHSNENWIHRGPLICTLSDLKFAQCRFESDWGHRSPYGSRFLDQDSAFGVVAWTSVAYHGFEWTTETADFRSAKFTDSLSRKSYLPRSRACVWLSLSFGVTTLSQLPREGPSGHKPAYTDSAQLLRASLSCLSNYASEPLCCSETNPDKGADGLILRQRSHPM